MARWDMVPFVSIVFSSDERILIVFSHHFWLRDHCRCSQCFHPVTKQRMVDTFAVCGMVSKDYRHLILPQLPPSLHPKTVVSKPKGLEVTCEILVSQCMISIKLHLTGPTSPPHVSLYPWQWLRHNSYDPRTEPISIAGTSPVPLPQEYVII